MEIHYCRRFFADHAKINVCNAQYLGWTKYIWLYIYLPLLGTCLNRNKNECSETSVNIMQLKCLMLQECAHICFFIHVVPAGHFTRSAKAYVIL
jgi:hypothetical protein